MFCEITFDDLQTGFYPVQDVFARSSLEEITPGNILNKWLTNVIRDKDFKITSLYKSGIKNSINIDYSSTIDRSCNAENETVLSEEYYRKVRQLKALEDIAGLLNDLSLEEMKIFEEAVKRRPLFE
jgi:hypothetical protein